MKFHTSLSVQTTLQRAVLWALLTGLPLHAQALVISDDFEAHSSLVALIGPGALQLQDPAAPGTELTESKIQHGVFNQAHAITAARATPTDFATNAKIDAREHLTRPLVDYAKVESVAHYGASLFNDRPVANFKLGMEFVIPPSFMELTLSSEFPGLSMSSSIDAFITLTRLPLPGSGGTPITSDLFRFHADVSGSFASGPTFSTSMALTPGVSLVTFASPTVTITNASGGPGCGEFQAQCTFLYEFDELAGAIDLGVLSPGEAIAINYFMTANVAGPAMFSGAIAAINDPFFFSGDAVTPVARPAFVELAAVPLPGSAALLGSALLLAARASRCRATKLQRKG